MRETIRTLREMNARLSTDDAPLWAEVLGFVLAVGFVFRSLAYVTSALIFDVDPQLRDQYVTRRSPVASIDDDWHAALSARILSLSVGLLLLQIAVDGSPMIGAAYVGANAVVPLVDPILYASTHNS